VFLVFALTNSAAAYLKMHHVVNADYGWRDEVFQRHFTAATHKCLWVMCFCYFVLAMAVAA
jgi:hypothetical protein